MSRITRNFITILLLICFVNMIIGRPQPMDENEGEAEAAYYNSDDSVASDSLRDEQESRMRNEELQAAQLVNRDHHYKENEQRNVKDEDSNLTWDNFSEMKRDNSGGNINNARRDSEAANSDDRTVAKRRAINYIESSETNEQSSSDMHDKRNLDGQAKGQDLSDLIIFDNSRDQLNKMEKNMYKDVSPSQEDPRYIQQFNQPYMDRSSKDKQYPTRERRQTQETTEKDSNASNPPKDNEASLIKQQIQELNSQELEELLNSLSGDKRSLLKKILEDNPTDNLSKREITKKAGTVEESNCVETSQIVLSDKQGGSLMTESPRTEPSEVTKDAESATTKVTDISNDTKVELSSDDSQLTANKANLIADSANNVEVTQQDSKIESKREANINEDVGFEGPEEQCSDMYSAAVADESNLQESDHNNVKREVSSEDSDSEAMKSLEESFPNPKSYEDSNNDSNMAPLVRVKRKDFEIVKKRSANFVQNGNVAYVPYNAENGDDNEEAGEFEDEGFNDQVPTGDKKYAHEKSNEISLQGSESRSQEMKSDKDSQYNCPLREQALAANSERENEAIGSDTDSVISGVEGADENLMYGSGSRVKRNLEQIYKPDGDLNRVYRTTPVVENEIQSDSENINVGNYQENDAFGPLPRNYEGDLGRYKRVRHVKQK